jgi:hypothetical protein
MRTTDDDDRFRQGGLNKIGQGKGPVDLSGKHVRDADHVGFFGYNPFDRFAVTVAENRVSLLVDRRGC